MLRWILYYSSVLSIMRQSKAQQKMIFVDACFAGKMRNTNKRNTNYSKENVMFFLSSRSTEKSLETPRQTGFKNSLFTVFWNMACEVVLIQTRIGLSRLRKSIISCIKE